MKIRGILVVLVVCVFCFSVNKTHAHKTPQLVKNGFAVTVYLELNDAQGHPVSYGNGFFVSPTLVVTTFHVVAGTTQGTARLVGNPKTYPIEGVMLTDEKDNLALLQVKIPNVRPLDLGDVNDTFLHDVDSNNHQVYVIGNYQGAENSFSEGEAVGISIGKWISEDDTFERVWERDRILLPTMISPGCSGGPVLNIRGAVIGVASMVIKDGKTYNYAIPTKYIKPLLEAKQPVIPLEASPKTISAVTYYSRGNTKYTLGMYNAAISDYTAAIRLDPNYVDAFYSRGNARRELGQDDDVVSAIIDYDAAIRLDSNYAAAYNGRGLVKHSMGQYKAAVADFDTAIHLNPDAAVFYNNRGLAKLEIGRKDATDRLARNPDAINIVNEKGIHIFEIGLQAAATAAISDFDTAIRLDPDAAVFYNNRGLAKMELKSYGTPTQKTAAISDFDTAIRLDPDYAQAFFNRGNVKAPISADKISAVNDYDVVIRLDPNYVEAYFKRAAAKQKSNFSFDPMPDYNIIIERNLDNVSVYYLRGMLRADRGQYEAALADLDTFLQKKTDAVDGYYQRGRVKLVLGQHRSAAADFTAVIHLDADKFVDSYYYRGRVKRELGQHADTLSDYKNFIKRNPKALNFFHEQVVYAEGKLVGYDTAIADHNIYIQIRPNEAEGYRSRGHLKMRFEKYEAALSDFDTAIHLNPDDNNAYYSRGKAKAALGKYTDAVSDYDAAIRIEPSYTWYHYERGKIRLELGQNEAAIADFDTVIKLESQSYKKIVVYYDRGVAKENLGRYTEAIADYDKALAALGKYSSYPEAAFRRGLAKKQIGQVEEAKKDFETALKWAKPKKNVELQNKIREELERFK